MPVHIRVVALNDDNTLKTNQSGNLDGQAFIADGAEILGVAPDSVVNTAVTAIVQRTVAIQNGFPVLREVPRTFAATPGKVAVAVGESALVEGMGGIAEANYAARTYATVEIVTA